jgi:hypothetical protein
MLVCCAGAAFGQPANDNCAQAIVVTNGDTAFSTVGATTDGPAHAACAATGDDQVSPDVWFQYTATCGETVAVLLCNTQFPFDTKLAVYNGCNCAAVSDANLVGCDNNGCQFMGLSSLTFPATAGNCYLIRVGGNFGASGDGTLSISCGFPACNAQNPNNCFMANASTGCGNVACCNIVCAVDPFCCNIQWDGICAGEAGTMCPITIDAANPPTAAANPYQPGQPFTDVLDTGMGATVTAGIGAIGTLPQGMIQYDPISVTFSAMPNPFPDASNVTISCTGGSQPCPAVALVLPGANPNQFDVFLTGGIPPLSCTTFTFAGTGPGQKLQYRSNPGNVNLDGSSNTQDLLSLVLALNNGSANMAANFARYNVNRSQEGTPVNTQDLLRLVQLLNGVNTTQTFAGAAAAACPP